MFSQRPDLFSCNRFETAPLSRSEVIYNDGIIYVAELFKIVFIDP